MVSAAVPQRPVAFAIRTYRPTARASRGQRYDLVDIGNLGIATVVAVEELANQFVAMGSLQIAPYAEISYPMRNRFGRKSSLK